MRGARDAASACRRARGAPARVPAASSSPYKHHTSDSARHRMARMSKVGLGTAPLGGLFEEVPPETARATVDAAWALGVRFFDTAPVYGPGLAERRLGEALADRPRSEYTLSTKVGRLLRPEPVYDFSPEGVRLSLAESLERLGLEHVDIALLHDPE